jgi:hypothetical protein
VKFFRRLLRLFRPKVDPLPPPLNLFDVLKTVQQAQKTLSVANYQALDVLDNSAPGKWALDFANWHSKSEFALSQLHNSLRDALETQRLEQLNRDRVLRVESDL